MAEYETLLQGLSPDTAVLVLPQSGDALDWLAAQLAGFSYLAAIHVLSHGSTGAVQLGGKSLTSDSLSQFAALTSALGAALNADGDILLYGCNVAAGQTGVEFIGKLAQATGADVAASDNVTGAHGDWNLESSAGGINTFPLAGLERYPFILATPVFGAIGLSSSDTTLISHYEFNGSITDTYANDTVTVYGAATADGSPQNDTSSFDTDPTGTYWQWTTTEPKGGGFTLDANLSDRQSYSIALRFRFNEVTGYNKIIDYLNRTADTGFYVFGGQISFYNLGTSALATPFEANALIDLIATRDGSTDTFAVWLSNGSGGYVKALEVVDAGDQSVPFLPALNLARFGFFYDDSANGLNEATNGGKVYEIKIWNRPLTPAEITTALGSITLHETNIRSAPQLLNINLPVTDADGNYNGGTYRVALTGGTATESLSIKNVGTGAGQIGFVGNDISYAGTVFGTVAGGNAGTDLVITFNGNANNLNVSAIASALLYGNTSAAPPGSKTLTFSVVDAANETATQAATIGITAVNDAPTITGTPTDVTVTEDTASNFDLSAVTVADVDSNTLTLTLTASGGSFAASTSGSVTIGGSGTGTLTLQGAPADINAWLDTITNIQYTSALNASGDNAASFTLKANDGTVDSSTANGNIDITAVNDAPTITSNGAGSIAAINVAENSTSVTTVVATDADAGQTVTYSITGGADQGKFSIVGATGVLTFASAPDFETPTDSGANNTYEVIVQASDGNGGIDTQAITVNVFDVFEAAIPAPALPVPSPPVPTPPPTPQPLPGTALLQIPSVPSGVTLTSSTSTHSNGTFMAISGLTNDLSSPSGLITVSLSSEQIALNIPEKTHINLATYEGPLPQQLHTATATFLGSGTTISNGIDLFTTNNPNGQVLSLDVQPTTHADTVVGGMGTLTISGLSSTPNTALFINTSSNGTVVGGSGLDNFIPPTISLNNFPFAAISGAATVVGGTGSIFIVGGSFSQSIFQGADDDTLYGGDGDDLIGSAGGNDQVFGDGGNDTVFGGVGADSLSGGTGDDTFTFAFRTDSTVSSMDVITDWQSGDTIEFTGIVGVNFAPVTQTYSGSVSATMTAISGNASLANQVVFFTDGTDGYVTVKGAGTGINFDGTVIKLEGVKTAPAAAHISDGINATILLTPNQHVALNSPGVKVVSIYEHDNFSESVTLGPNANHIFVSQYVDRVHFNGSVSSYLFQHVNNSLHVYDIRGGLLIAKINIPSDHEGTTLSWASGMSKAYMQGDTMMIGETTVSSQSPTSLNLSLNSFAAISGDQNTRVYLRGEESEFSVSNDDMRIYGGSGSDVVVIESGTLGTQINKKVEQVVFDKSSNEYRFLQSDSLLNVYDNDNQSIVAHITIQNDTDGTLLSFSDVEAAAQIRSGSMRIGSATVSQTNPTALNVDAEVATTSAQLMGVAEWGALNSF